MKPLLTGVLMTGLAALSFSAVVSINKTDKDVNSAPVVLKAHESVPATPSVAASSLTTIADNRVADAVSQRPASLPAGISPFGSNIGGSFDLIDHFGNAKQLEDYRGKHVMIFFGYANCLAICSAALPLMADTIDLLDEAGQEKLVPLMITVDPKNDTPAFMRKKLAEYHPSLIGMTGSDGALADVRSKFQVRTEYVGEDIEGNPIFNHGSFIYLLGPDGKFQTLVPPILGADQMATIIKKYLMKAEG